jgi:phage repressor protein C with HTH and peptisase S24 domain
LAFSRDWLASELGLEPARAAYLEMEGDAMEPTLRPGACLLVDRSVGERGSWEGIYALYLDGELLVKRLQRLPDRRIKVSCDNPAYEDFLLPLEGSEPQLEVVGQVVWVGRRL